MNMKWSLDALYSSFESEEFNNDFKKLETLIEETKKWCEENLVSTENSVEKTEYYLNNSIEVQKLASKLMGFAHLTLSVETKNKQALKIQDKLQTMLTELTKPKVVFKKWISTLENIDDLINKSDFLKTHEFHIKEISESGKYLLSDNEEVILAKMSTTGSSSWARLQKIVSSNLLVDIEIDGENKELPISVVRNMAFDSDSETRKKGYFAEIKAYEKVEESSAAALNGIKGEVLTVSELRGFDSPLDETLFNSRMDKDTLNAMLEAMEESLPIFHKYYKRKAEILGHENGLPFYDLFAPVGNVEMKFTYEEAKDYVVNNFRKFSDNLADYAQKAFNNNWIDAEPKEGKVGGAFCSNIHAIGESRILTNFNGSFKNMNTLAHELGHGYHGQSLKNESTLNATYPMPLAETASIFCETIVKNAAIKEANKEETFSILGNTIMGYAQVIVDIYSRYLFETELFEIRKDHSLSVDELKDIMISAQKKAYGFSLDHDYLHPYMWANKPHYYYTNRNFYNFPYAFGLLFAKGLYAEYLNSGDAFIEQYDNLLAATGKNTIADVAKMMNIDVKDKAFWKQSLKLLEEDIERFLELSQK